MATFPAAAQRTDLGALSVALIVPDAGQRRKLVGLLADLNIRAVHQYAELPDSGAVPTLPEPGCDVYVVALNENVDQALVLIESICSRTPAATVMACASGAAPDLLLRAMQAGAREFLVEPVSPAVMTDALIRALTRRDKGERRTPAGHMFVFASTKGGAGATTIATNFAVALAEENAGRVVVADLDFQLGEVALDLGLSPKFSILDALQNIDRLDSVFLLSLLGKHTSGLSVLAAPEQYTAFTRIMDGLDRLFQILREQFVYVVVDAGSLGGVQDSLFDLADTIYLVTETSIPALRNARRMLSFIAGLEHSPHPEVILNRFNSKEVDLDETSVAKALARPVNWKIPNDFSAARSAENTGIPIAMKDSAITRVLRQMARAACGKPALPGRKSSAFLALFQ